MDTNEHESNRRELGTTTEYTETEGCVPPVCCWFLNSDHKPVAFQTCPGSFRVLRVFRGCSTSPKPRQDHGRGKGTGGRFGRRP